MFELSVLDHGLMCKRHTWIFIEINWIESESVRAEPQNPWSWIKKNISLSSSLFMSLLHSTDKDRGLLYKDFMFIYIC